MQRTRIAILAFSLFAALAAPAQAYLDSGPQVAITSPPPGSIVNGIVPIVFTARNYAADVAEDSWASIDGGNWIQFNPALSDSNTYYYNTTDSATGAHTVRIKVSDDDDDTGYSEARTLYVDNTPPVISEVRATLPGTQTKLRPGQSVTFSARIVDALAGVDDSTVWLRIFERNYQMYDDGTQGDSIVGDGVYMRTLLIPSDSVAHGDTSFRITAGDTSPYIRVTNLDTMTGVLSIDSAPPRFRYYVALDADTRYSGGDLMSFRVFVDSDALPGDGLGGLSFRSDFTSTAGEPTGGPMYVREDGRGTYTIFFPISVSTSPSTLYAKNLTVFNANGWEDTLTWRWYRTGVSPSLTFTSPAAGSVLNDTARLLISFTSPDTWNTFDTCFYVDGRHGGSIVDTRVDWGTQYDSDGYHSLLLSVRGSLRDTFYSQPVVYYSDNTPPSLSEFTITYPAGQTAARPGQSVLFSMRVTDAIAGVNDSYVLLRVFGSDTPLYDNASNGDSIARDRIYSRRIVVPAIPGMHGDTTIHFAASDTAPLFSRVNADTVARSLSIDSLPPVIRTIVTLDADTVYAAGSAVTIRILADSDATGIGESGLIVHADFSRADSSYVTGREVVSDDGNGIYTIVYALSKTDTKVNGLLPVTIRVTDRVGLETTSTWWIVMNDDDSRPALSFTAPPAGAYINRATTLAFTITAQPQGRTLTDTRISIDGGAYVATSGAATHALNTLSLAPGAHTFRLSVRDTRGESWYSEPTIFIVDNDTPAVSSVTVAYPGSQSAVRPGQVVTFKAQVLNNDSTSMSVYLDAFSKRFLMYDDGSNGDAIARDRIYSRSLTIGSAVGMDSGFNGDTAFAVVAVESSLHFVAVNMETIPSTFTGDSAPPVFRRINTLDADTVYKAGQAVTIRVYLDTDVLDPGDSGLTLTADFTAVDSAFLPGRVITAANGSGTYTLTYVLSESDTRVNGIRPVTLRATDGAGFETTFTWWIELVNVDSVPVVALTFPPAGAAINRTTVCSFSVFGAPRSRTLLDTWISIDGGPYVATSGGLFHSVNTLSLAPGPHTFRLRVRDSAGDSWYSDPTIYVVDNDTPAVSSVTVAYPGSQSAVRPGQVVTFKAQVLNNDSTSMSVYLDAFSKRFLMYDDGSNGDAIARDRIYSRALTIGSAVGMDSGFNGDTAFAVVAVESSLHFVAVNMETIPSAFTGDSAPPVFRRIHTLDADTVYKAGQAVTIRVYLDTDVLDPGDSGLTLTADFSLVDSSFAPGRVITAANGSGTYTLVYVLSENDTRVNGILPVTVRATDGVGFETTILWLIELNNLDSKPVITFTAPPAGAAINGVQPLHFTVTGQPRGRTLSDTRISIDGGAYNLTTGDSFHQLNTNTLAHGPHTFRLRVRDSAGDSWYSDPTIYVIDNDTPAVSNVTVAYPGSQSAVRPGQTVTFKAQVLNNDSTSMSVYLDAFSKRFLMYDDGSNGDAIARDRIYSRALTIGSAVGMDSGFNGDTVFAVVAIESSLQFVQVNMETIPSAFTGDSAPPVFRRINTLDADTVYKAGQAVSIRVYLDTDVLDPGDSGLTLTADFSLVDSSFAPGRVITAANGSGTYTLVYVLSENDTRVNGILPVTLRATDGVGLETTIVWLIELNNLDSKPVLSFIAPPAGAAINGIQPLYFTINGQPRGRTLSDTRISIDGGAYNLTTGDSFHQLNTNTLAHGPHTFRLRVRDSAGDSWYSEPTIFIVDNDTPAVSNVTVAYPGSQSAVRPGQVVTFKAQVLNNDSTSMSVYLDAFSKRFLMYDDGSNGDAIARDRIYSRALTIGSAVGMDSGFNGDTVFAVVAIESSLQFVQVNMETVPSTFTGDSAPPRFRNFLALDLDTTYANGRTIRFQVFYDTDGAVPGEGGLTITADFSSIDGPYIRGSEIVADDGQGTYTIRHTIAVNNNRGDGPDSPIYVVARDGVGYTETVVWKVSLSNYSNPAPTVAFIDLVDTQEGTDSAHENWINDNDTLIVHCTTTALNIYAIEYHIDAIGGDSTGLALAAADGAYNSTSETGIATINVGGLLDGYHVLYAHGMDSNRVWGVYKSETFILDRRGPSVTNVTVNYLRGGQWVKNGETVTITAVVSDAISAIDTVWVDATALNGNAGLRMFDDGTSGDAVSGDGVYSRAITVTQLSNPRTATVSCTVAAHDVIRNRTTYPLNVNKDDSPPIFGMAVTDDADTVYANGQLVRITVFIDSDANDSLSAPPGERRLSIRADFGAVSDKFGRAEVHVSDDSSGFYTITYTIPTTNTHPDVLNAAVLITAADEAGNEDTKIWRISLDNNVPVNPYVIALAFGDSQIGTDSARDYIFNDNDTVMVYIGDTAPLPLRSAEFFIDYVAGNGEGDTLFPVDGLWGGFYETTTAAVNIGRLADGMHYLMAHAQDTELRWGAFRTETFIVDRAAPVVSNIVIAYPSGQAAVKAGDTVLVSAIVTDATTRVDTVWIDATALSGETGIRMVDDGTGGDLFAGDNVYSARVTIFRPLTGTATCTVGANDIVRNMGQVAIPILRNDSPARVRYAIARDPDTVYANGQTLLFSVYVDSADLLSPGDSGLSITTDFTAVDGNYVAGSEIVSDDGRGTYTIRYTITATNPRSDGNDSRIVVTVLDNARNLDTFVWLVSLDNAAPAVTFLDISDLPLGTDRAKDSYLNDNDTFLVSFRDGTQPVTAAEFFVDQMGRNGEGTALAALDGAFSGLDETCVGVLSTASLADGWHTLYAHGRDTAGNWGAVSSVTFAVDRTPPVLTNLQVIYPGSASSVSAGNTIRVTIEATEILSRIDSVYIDARTLNDSIQVLMNDSGYGGDVTAGDNVYTASITCSVALTGAASCTVVASDTVRNFTRVFFTVNRDDSRPIVRYVTTTDPDTIYRNGQTVIVKVFADTDGAGDGVTGLALTANFGCIDSHYIRGSEIVSDDGRGTYTIRYLVSPTNLASDRNDTLVILGIVSSVGTGDSSWWPVSLDNNGPTVIFADIEDTRGGSDRAKDRFINDDDSVILALRDTTQFVVAAEFFLDIVGRESEGLRVPSVDGAFDSLLETAAATLNLSLLTDGVHTLYARALDRAGNWGPVRAETFTVDRRPPQILNVSINLGPRPIPRDGDTITVSALVLDATTRVESVTLVSQNLADTPVIALLDDGLNGDAAAGDSVFTCRFPLRTNNFTGTETFRLVAFDIVRNTDTVTETFTVRAPVAPVIQYILVSDTDRVYKDGGTVKLTAYVTVGGAGTDGLRVSANFLPLDTTYVTGSEIVSDDGRGTYTIRYTLAVNNTVWNTESIPVVVRAVNDTEFCTRSILIHLRNGAGDFIPPDSCDIREPAVDSSFNGPVRVRIYASDDLGLDQIELYRVDMHGETRLVSTVNLTTWPQNSRVDLMWSVSTETQGIYNLFAIAYDRHHNQRYSRSVRIMIDRTHPVFTSISVENTLGFVTGTFSNGETIVLIVQTNEIGDSITADFSVIDSEYRNGYETILRSQSLGLAARARASALDAARALATGYFEIHYRISVNNKRPNGMYHIPITITDTAGNRTVLSAAMTLQTNSVTMPSPNPYLGGRNFAPGDLTTGIVFRPVEAGATVDIYNLRGNLVNRLQSAGNAYIHWNVTDRTGANVASGYYFYVVTNPSGSMYRGKLAVVR